MKCKVLRKKIQCLFLGEHAPVMTNEQQEVTALILKYRDDRSLLRDTYQTISDVFKWQRHYASMTAINRSL
jgi:hypothetical protein